MADYQTYRPRRTRSGNRWGSVVIVVVVVIILIVAGKLMFGGNGSSTTNSADSGIDLVTDNTSSETTANTNTATNTSASSLASAWDGFSVTSCPRAISTLPTAKTIVLTVGLSAANDQVGTAIDALKQADAPADFLVSGTFADDHPDVVQLASQAGYAVYSQSYDGTDLSLSKESDVTAAITKAETAISTATGVTTKPIFRPPAGSYTDTTVSLLHDQGYCTVLWTVDAYDWQAGITVEQAQERVMTAVAKQTGGSIVALHAGYDVTPALITSLIPALRSAGYTLTTFASAMNQ